ncbi:MAG TPA: TlpA disulfide reductase family protein [Fulvivirga sp.]|nr:TlpA disulfide reductase family protein [Fulvivirga sp.]
MRQQIKFLFIVFIFLNCTKHQDSMFMSSEFVNLKGKESLTIIKNLTSDTLHLTGTFFNDLPYAENPFTLSIAPNQKDTLKFQFTYPDFIHFDAPFYFRLFNIPGKTLSCEISSITSKSAQITFQGEISDINKYYLTYHNQMGSRYENNRPFFEMGDRIKNLYKFPAIADSISQLSIDFLNNYDEQLPNWFKKHEKWRLKYLSAFLIDNVLMSKEFYGGKKINVSDDYFSFQNELSFENEEMIFNNQYLWYTRTYIGRRTRLHAQQENKDLSKAIFDFSIIDSLFKDKKVGDILRMDKLSSIYHAGFKSEYDSLIKNMAFYDNSNKELLDSLINVKYGLPRVGVKIPSISLIDLDGNEVSLDDFKGTHIIINFWAVWCGPCIKEFPHENKLYKENKDKGLTVINICVDSEMSQWESVSNRQDLQMINVYTDNNEYKRIAKKFGIYGLPKSILLGEDLSVINNNFKRASLLTETEINKILE